MNNRLIVALLLLSLACQACYRPRCKEKDVFFCEFPLSGRRYFEAYKEGTFWVYYNRDYSKMDSVYVENYNEYIKKPEDEVCWDFKERQFVLSNTYLSVSTIPVLGEMTNIRCDLGKFSLVWEGGNFSNTKALCLHAQDTGRMVACNSDSVRHIPIFNLRGNPQLQLPSVLVVDGRYWLAPDFGLIQYVSYDGVDTFFIERFNGR